MNDKQSIKSWLKIHNIKNYEIIEVAQKFVVNVEGDVDLCRKNLKHIPVKFNVVSGSFNCDSNSLISLYNAPRSVGGEFTCASNMLMSLEGCPTDVGAIFSCFENKLESLQYCPTSVGGSFICSSNMLTSLEYCPQNVNGNFNCANNQLASLQYCPQKTSGWFQCNHNNIQNFKFAPQFVGGYFSCYSNEELRSYQNISKLSQLDEYLRAQKEVKILSEAVGQETLKKVIQKI